VPEVDVGVPEVDVGVPEVDVGVPEVDVGVPLRQRRQGEPVHLRGERVVPGQPGAVLATAPGGGAAGHAAEGGQECAHRCGPPPGRSRQPGGGAQQVDREVGGERDRRLEVVVDRRLGRHRGQRRGHGGGRGDGGDGPGGPVRAGPQPVDPQRGGPPGQVRTVGAGAPGGDAAAEHAPPGRGGRTGGRRAGPAGVDAEHADRQSGSESGGEVPGAEELRGAGGRRAGAEQARDGGGPGSGHVGPGCLCRLDRHVPPSREVVAAAGEGTAGKEESRDDGARGPAPRTSWSGRVTEPLRDPLRQVDDPPPEPVTCRHPTGKDQVRPVISGR
jgi:hypothetical protein